MIAMVGWMMMAMASRAVRVFYAASNVSLLFAREWKVSGKVYRVTWSTGAFLQYLAGRYYSLAGEDAV